MQGSLERHFRESVESAKRIADIMIMKYVETNLPGDPASSGSQINGVENTSVSYKAISLKLTALQEHVRPLGREHTGAGNQYVSAVVEDLADRLTDYIEEMASLGYVDLNSEEMSYDVLYQVLSQILKEIDVDPLLHRLCAYGSEGRRK